MNPTATQSRTATPTENLNRLAERQSGAFTLQAHTATPTENLSFLRFEQVSAKTGLRRTKIYDMVAKGEFPAPYKLPGGQASAWLSSEVDQWILDIVASASREVSA